MPDFIREGGWPMFPTLSFGLVALILAAFHAAKPAPGQASLARTFALLSVVMGCLGAVLGLQISIGAIRATAPDQRWIVMVGLAESLQNVVAALGLLLPTTIALGVGNYRSTQSDS